MKLKSSINFYFLLSFFGIFLIKFQSEAYQNSLLVNAQIWAETGTNYFANSHFDLWPSLLKTDSSYLVVIQRLIAWSYTFFFSSSRYFFEYCGLISLIFICFCCSYINCKVNRNLIASDASRFLLSICLCFAKDYELHTFVNFVYFGWIPLILVLVNPQIESQKGLGLYLSYFLTSIIILSKGMFVVALPIIFIFYFFHRHQKRAWFKFIFIVPILIQALMLYMDVDHVKPKSGILNRDLVSLSWGLITSPFVNMARFIFYSFSEEWKKVGLLTIFGLFAVYYRKNLLARPLNSGQKTLILSSLLTLAANHFLILMSSKTLVPSFPNLMPDLVEGRAFYVGLISIFMAFWIIIESMNARRARSKWLLLLILALSSALKPKITFADPAPPTIGNYEKLMVNERLDLPQHCIPINPYPWFLLKNCSALAKAPEFSELLSIEKEVTYEFPLALNKNRIILIGVKDPLGVNLAVEDQGHMYPLKKTTAQNGVSYFESEQGIPGSAKLVFYYKGSPQASKEIHFSLENALIFGN